MDGISFVFGIVVFGALVNSGLKAVAEAIKVAIPRNVEVNHTK